MKYALFKRHCCVVTEETTNSSFIVFVIHNGKTLVHENKATEHEQNKPQQKKLFSLKYKTVL